jgi:hypothetical protein
MIWVIGNLCIFKTVADTNMKQLQKSKETHQVFVGNIDYNISAVSGALITVKGKWCPKCGRLG